MGARVLCVLLVIGPIALADDASDRAKLNGTWQAQDGKSGATWTLEKKDNTIHIIQSENGQKVLEFDCDTNGKECEVTDNGHKAKVSMYYNGPKLVALESRGTEIVRRRFTVAAEKDTLEVELIPVAPAGKAETSQFRRAEVAAAGR